ncbi:hypothetical protein [Microbulbifer sp. SAOS-129_SWC]|uniref:hypothetical protein n=1 Tax=Microbulbifer sp. SAOS-129_SWC TaxID=3145235 RepID=UPI003218062F
MDWIQRYVDNVKTYLPGAQREDIGSELQANLHDQRDDLAASLGRAPTEAEVLALLKEKGHPMAVAAAYQPRRVLVGEALFPLYSLVLKWVLLAVMIANGVVALLGLIGQSEPAFSRVALQWLGGTYESGLQSFAWITLFFYLAGEGVGYRDVFGKWDPRKLPRVAAGGKRISQFESAAQLVAMVLLMGWLNDFFTPAAPAIGSASFVLGDALRGLLPWLNLGIGVSITMALVKLVWPFWTPRKLLLDSAVHVYWLMLLVPLFALDTVFSVHWDGGQWEMPEGTWQAIIAADFAILAFELGRNCLRLRRSSAR